MSTKKIYNCQICKYKTKEMTNIQNHFNSIYHIKLTTNYKTSKHQSKDKIFECKICKYETNYESNLNKHCMTNRHMKLSNTTFDDMFICMRNKII
jgi:hypothetical protein